MRSPKRRRVKGICGVVVGAGLLASCSVLPMDWSEMKPESITRTAAQTEDAAGPQRAGAHTSARTDSPAPAGRELPPVGAFLRSDERGVEAMKRLERWLGGTPLRVGHTYLPGDLWSNIEGQPRFLAPWAKWRKGQRDRMFVLNVPMLERNEEDLPDREVRGLLRDGASGRFDAHYRTLAKRLVGAGLRDTIVVLGWEMNGTTYSHRCGPDVKAWKKYWQRIVRTMRSVEGQKFRFDFTPSRGRDAVPWTECYPGDDYVDVIGMDTYDQPAGQPFETHVHEAYGLKAQVDFAAEHGKEISYPEWGLFRNGDNPEYVRRMLEWFDQHKPLYQTITDYCPHGVWQCTHNPDSAETFRAAFYGRGDGGGPAPAPTPKEPERPAPPARKPWIDKCIDDLDICIRIDNKWPDWLS